jgi:hypothetical protein
MVRRKRTVLYFLIALGMLIYAAPRLPIGGGWTVETIFGVAWICMALLIIAGQLHELFGVDEKTEQEIRAIRRFKYWRLQRSILEADAQARRDRSAG